MESIKNKLSKINSFIIFTCLLLLIVIFIFLRIIIGHGWNPGGEDYGVNGFDGLANTNWNILNCYTTGDFSFASWANEIPGLPIGNYTATVEDLWVDPANGNFNFKDTGFPGKGNSGDPRWRLGL